MVMLDVYCTVRDSLRENVSDERFWRWASTVGAIAADYEHVVLHIANEHWHGGSRLQSPESMREAKRLLREAGFMGLIGSDQNFTRNNKRAMCDSLGGVIEFCSGHPWRRPNPTREELFALERTNPGFIIDEPQAYTTLPDLVDETCCTDSRKEIQRYICDGEDAGIRMVFHSTCGLEWPLGCSMDIWLPTSCDVQPLTTRLQSVSMPQQRRFPWD